MHHWHQWMRKGCPFGFLLHQHMLLSSLALNINCPGQSLFSKQVLALSQFCRQLIFGLADTYSRELFTLSDNPLCSSGKIRYFSLDTYVSLRLAVCVCVESGLSGTMLIEHVETTEEQGSSIVKTDD